jgi:SAM-dependent methyltransferase
VAWAHVPPHRLELTLKIRVESPERVERAICTISGWWIIKRGSSERVQVRVNGRMVTPQTRVRPDVERVFPDLDSAGFMLTVDIGEVREERVRLELVVDGSVSGSASLDVAPEARLEAERNSQRRSTKRDWLIPRLRCPDCRRSHTLINDCGAFLCRECSTTYPQSTGALNLLSDALYKEAAIQPTANVSAHPYSPDARRLINRLAKRDGAVLDVGAGLRSHVDERVVSLEIVDYPTVDVLGVAQSLPFEDEVFDGVMVLAVLEHVPDPQKCADEIMRVLKPGGTVLAEIPFLQPEHGFPEHFFNATRAGIRWLFRELVDVEQHVPDAGHPMVSLHWIASWYLAGLPQPERDQLRSTTIGDLVDSGRADLLQSEIATKRAGSPAATPSRSTAPCWAGCRL